MCLFSNDPNKVCDHAECLILSTIKEQNNELFLNNQNTTRTTIPMNENYMADKSEEVNACLQRISSLEEEVARLKNVVTKMEGVLINNGLM